jgi:hypothetical protein
MIIKDDHLYLPTGEGHFVSEKQRRIAELIKEVYPYTELQWIPPNERGPDEFAFRVVDVTPGRRPYVAVLAHECDERLLAKLIQADNTKRDVLNYLDCHNAAVELYEAKKRKEERMELHEMAYTILRSRKEHFRHKGFNFGVFGGR